MYLIRPTRDLVVPTTDGGDLPAAGMIAPEIDLYWRRRRADGDVTIDVVEAETVEAAVAELAAKKRPASVTSETKG